MTQLKKHIAYTFLVTFVAGTITAFAGVLGKFTIDAEGLRWLFGLLLAQCATVVITMIKAPEYFSEPEAIRNLQDANMKAMTQRDTFHANEKANLEQSLRQEMAGKDKKIADQQIHIKALAGAIQIRSDGGTIPKLPSPRQR